MTLTLFHKVFYIGILLGLVFITLAITYLAIQVKHYSDTSRYNTHITFLGSFLRFNIALAQRKELADVYQRGLRGLKGLGREEQSQFFSIATYIFHYWNEAYRGSELGQIPPEYWIEARSILVDFVQFPGVQEYWEYRKHWYSKELQKVVDELISKIPADAKPVYPETIT